MDMATPGVPDNESSFLDLVAPEIDRCLAGASDTLDRWSAKSADIAHLGRAREELAVLRGAMEVIQLTGVPRVVLELEALFGDLARRQVATENDASAAGRYAIGAVRRYVSGLVSHSPPDMAALAQILQELFKARGSDRFAALELFQPDLSPLPPERPGGTVADGQDAREIFQAARGDFQKGLLAWLRRGERDGLTSMRNAIERAEAACVTALARAPWWVAGGLLDLLIEDALKTDVRIKRLCSALDQLLRRAIEGVAEFPRELMREMLFFVGAGTGASERAQAIRRTYGIEVIVVQAWKADERSVPFMRQFAPLRDLQEVFEQAARGEAAAYTSFREGMAEIKRQAPVDPRLENLLQEVMNAASRFGAESHAASDVLAVETATTLLFLQDIMSRWNTPDAELVGRIDAVTQRLRGAATGHFDCDALEWAGLFGAARRKAQNNALIQRVASELISTVLNAEQRLNRFFEDDNAHPELADVHAALEQSWGTLMILGEEAAAATAASCLERIGKLNKDKHAASQDDYAWLATHLSGLRFFLEQLRFGRADFKQIMTKAGHPQASRDPAEPVPPSTAANGLPGAAIADVLPPKHPTDAVWDMPGDLELLGAVIEEAQKLLAELHAALIRLRAQDDPAPLLASIRRGFHTMKGGFNMVELIRMGMAAGEMERLVSDEPERVLAPQLLDLLETAHRQFCLWVGQLASDGKALVDASGLIDSVRRLRQGRDSSRTVQERRPYEPSFSAAQSLRPSIEWREQVPAVFATLGAIAENVARLREQARELETRTQPAPVTRGADQDENASHTDSFVQVQSLARIFLSGAEQLSAVHCDLLRQADGAKSV
jgi:chemosensory pili system protein ChpA (sensor histidine kinase/response regulator)